LASITKTDYDASGSDLSAFTFVCSIGADGGADTLIFTIYGRRNSAVARDFSSVTVDGVAATQVVKAGDTAGTYQVSIAAVYKISRNALPDPAQTDVDVVVTWTGSMNRGCACTMFVTADAIESAAFDTAIVANDNPTAPVTSTTLTLDVDVPTGGFLVGAAGGSGSAGDTDTWTGATEQDNHVSPGSFTYYTSALSNNFGSAETPRTVNVAISGSGIADYSAAVAVFEAAGAGGFQAAWAKGSNVMIGGGP